MGVESSENAVVITPEEADRMKAGLISLGLDLVVGFGTLIAAVILLALFHRVTSHVLLPIAGGIFFVAAMIRGIWGKLNPWMEGFAISLGALFPAALVMVATMHGANLMLWGAAILLVPICGAGVQAQRFWKQRRLWAGAGTVVALFAVVFLAGKFALGWLAGVGVHTMDRPAPRIGVTMLDGTPVTLGSMKGHVVVLDFWGTWCEPCLEEMPTIAKLHRFYQGNGDVMFLAVNAGWSDDTADKVRTFVERRHLDLPVALDTDDTTRRLGIDGLPTLVVIDPQGHIRMEAVGYNEGEPLEYELTGQIDALLKGTGSSHEGLR